MSGKKSKLDLEWERRVLCSDEACIGTIGPDGNCRECGQPYAGQLPDALLQTADGEAAPAPADDNVSDTPPAPDTDPDASGADASGVDASGVDSDDIADSDSDEDWAQRTLCRDESCIGVIGPDGLCKECGKPYTPGTQA